MSINPKLPGLLWVALSVALQSTAAALGKQAGLESAGAGLEGALLNFWYLTMLFCLGLQALCWVSALRKIPLSFAYPLMSLVLPLNLLASAMFFSESLHVANVVGIGIIVAGVTLVATEGV